MTVFGVAALKLTRVVEVKPLLPAFVAAVVHTAEVAGGILVVCSVALASADGHYTEDSLLSLLAATVSAGAWERERCSGDEKTVGPRAVMQCSLVVFGASEGAAMGQDQHAAIAGADAAAGGSVDTVDAVVDNSVVVGSAARWGCLLLKNASSEWPDSVWLVQLLAGHGLRWWHRSDKQAHNCPGPLRSG